MKTKLKKFLALLLALSLLSALYVPAAAAASITLKYGDQTLVASDVIYLTLNGDADADTATLQTNISSDEGDDAMYTVYWISESSNVATVEDGVVTAVGSGSTQVTAWLMNDDDEVKASATCTVSVTVLPTGIEVTERSGLDTLYRTGATAQLVADVKAEGTTGATDKTVTWSSSNPSIATITTSGVVTVVTETKGTHVVTFTATSTAKDSVKGTYTLTVVIPEHPVTDIRFVDPGSSATITAGEEITLKVYLSPINATVRTVLFSTTDTTVTFTSATTVEADGEGYATVKVRAKENIEGTAWIWATPVDSGNGIVDSTRCTLTIEMPKKVTSISLDPTETSVLLNKTREITAEVLPLGAANTTVIWKSLDPNKVTVKSKDGTNESKHGEPVIITGKALTGEDDPVEIRATTSDGGYTATCMVYVTDKEIQVKDIALEPKTATMDPGQEYTLTATVSPAYAYDRTLKWTSSDETIATVKDGVVTGVSPGEVTITATANDGSGISATSTVTVSGVTLQPAMLPLPAGGNTNIIMTRYGDAAKVTSWGWTSSDTSIARVNGSTGEVTGVSAGTATITANGGGYHGTCEITIKATGSQVIEADDYFANGQLDFSGSLLSALRSTCYDMTYKGTLDYIVNLFVPTAQGTLFDHYIAEPDPGAGISSTTRYYASADNAAGSSNLISNVYFVPKADYAGAITISYTGVSTDGNQYSGYITLQNQTDSGVQYNVFNGAPAQFRAADFSDYVQRQAGRAMRYVTFDLPSSRYGVLQYYNIGDGLYEREATAEARFYTGISPSLDDVWFVPDSTNRSDVSFKFHAYDSNGVKLTDGTVTIIVKSSDTAKRDGTNLSYSIPVGERLYFNIDDFSDACAAAGQGQLNYIFFSSLPSSARGTMYYGSSSRVYIGTGNPFYRSGSGYRRTISDLYFQAASGTNATGTTSFKYTGYDVNGVSFTGTIRITVTSGYGTSLYYSTRAGQRVWLSSTDFSNASYSATDRELNYICFNTTPSSARGTLYSLSDSVSTGLNYYRTYGSYNSRRLIEDLSFVPASGFTGTVVIPYTGYNVSGKSFTGTVTIYVGASQTATGDPLTERDPNATPLVYYSGGEAVPFWGSDFTTDAADKLPYNLSTIKFAQPKSNVGRLCTNYVSPTQYNLLDATESFTPQTVSNVYFQPKAGFNGSAAVTFFATDVTGKSYSGTLVVQVTLPERSSYFDDMYEHTWAVPSVELLTGYGVLEGTDYRMFSPAASMTRGDFILMLSRAFSFPYYGSLSFDDVPDTMYYASAIASAMALGIATGETAVILPEGYSEEEAETSDEEYPPEGSVILNVFRPDDPITREEAGVFLYRSMRRAGTMPVGSRENLTPFADGYAVSDWAVEAMGSLAALGVFEGDENGCLNPQGYLTRAEMATLFYRAIT